MRVAIVSNVSKYETGINRFDQPREPVFHLTLIDKKIKAKSRLRVVIRRV